MSTRTVAFEAPRWKPVGRLVSWSATGFGALLCWLLLYGWLAHRLWNLDIPFQNSLNLMLGGVLIVSGVIVALIWFELLRHWGRQVQSSRWRALSINQMLDLTPAQFEEYVAQRIFARQGYTVRNTPDTGDGGVDVLLTDRNGRLAVVQCKRYRSTVGEEIVRGGAVISDYPLGTKPEARNFPPRNRIISGLSRAVVIIEAGERSGALITAEFAADQGRDVWAVPGSILSMGSAGTNRLIREGASPLISMDDLLASLDLERRTAQRAARAAIPVNDQENALLAHLAFEPRHLDDIVRAARLDASSVGALLTIMELKGIVRQPAPLTYVKT